MMGKFDSERDEALYELSLDGGCDEECGSVQENGEWYGLITHFEGYAGAIVEENSQGFVHVGYYKNPQELLIDWDTIVDDIEKWYEQSEYVEA